jgi:hypothetical protein
VTPATQVNTLDESSRPTASPGTNYTIPDSSVFWETSKKRVTLRHWIASWSQILDILMEIQCGVFRVSNEEGQARTQTEDVRTSNGTEGA